MLENKRCFVHYYSDNQNIRRIMESMRVYILGYSSEYFMEGRDELHALRMERYPRLGSHSIDLIVGDPYWGSAARCRWNRQAPKMH